MGLYKWNEGYSYDVTDTLYYVKPYLWPTFFLTGFVNEVISSNKQKNEFQLGQCWQVIFL